MRMTLAASLLFVLIGPDLFYGQTFLYREKTDLADASAHGEVTIDIASTTLRQNEPYAIRYTFHATYGAYAVYNWQFNRLLDNPGQLVIYDQGRKYIGDLIAFTGGSRRTASDEDWTYLSSGSFLGTTLDFRAGFVPNSANGLLPPGTYYLQLVLYRAFLSPNPSRTVGAPIDRSRRFDELCRSNVITINIVGP